MTGSREKFLLLESDIIFFNEKNFSTMYKNFITKYDNPEPWGLFFQDNATPQMEALYLINTWIMVH